MENQQKSPRDVVREGLAAMKSCIHCGEPWTDEMQRAYDAARAASDALVEDGWRNCVGYLSNGSYSVVGDVPERTGATALWREFVHIRQLGLTGKEPDTRVQMLDRFAPMEAAVIAEVERLMKSGADPHTVTRLVVQALINGPDLALKETQE